MAAARPVPPADRGPFLEAVAAALRGREVGTGVVHRAIVKVQRAHFNPPDLSRGSDTSEYR
jgi:hypothetical protein